jgi:uncharacterized repeat protein (TIGR01451 family)
VTVPEIRDPSKTCRRNAPKSSSAGIVALLLGLAAPLTTWAICSCGFGDGRFTLTTINVDGNMGDWAPVHADLDNNVCDAPSGGLTDRDAPVQSTGRDLTHFAFTWDSNNIYLFTERAGSTSNTQSFAYYADIDNDGLMETNEPVIGVTWQGSNRNINVYVFTYVSFAPTGDPMVDTDGFGDGYTLPGSFGNVPSSGNPNRSGTWGSSTGLQMEFHVTWAELGVAPGVPFTFHVASSNASLGASSFAAQVDDNLSGCGGGLGSTAVPGADFMPDRSLTASAGQTVVGVHTISNTGNATDNYDLASLVSGDFTPVISYYEDTDASGTLTAGDTFLSDTNGDGDPNTADISPSASATILIAYYVPVGVGAGDNASIVTTAASDFQPLATSSITDMINIILRPMLEISKVVSTVEDPINITTNPKAIPGSEVLYTVTVENQGSGTVDADSIEITDAVPNDGCLIVTDITTPGSGPVRFDDGAPSSGLSYSFMGLLSTSDDLEFSSNGGLNYNYLPTAGPSGCDPLVTHIRINPGGTFAADSGSGSPQAVFSFRVLVN